MKISLQKNQARVLQRAIAPVYYIPDHSRSGRPRCITSLMKEFLNGWLFFVCVKECDAAARLIKKYSESRKYGFAAENARRVLFSREDYRNRIK